MALSGASNEDFPPLTPNNTPIADAIENALAPQLLAMREEFKMLSELRANENTRVAEERAEAMQGQEQMIRLLPQMQSLPEEQEVAQAPRPQTLRFQDPDPRLSRGVPPVASTEDAKLDPDSAETEAAEADAELEEMMEQLEMDEGVDTFASAFKGHPTPVPFFEGEGRRIPNPYARSHAFRSRTAHYQPSVVGDGLQGALCTKLEAMGSGCELYALEARSLVSTCSYTYDVWEELRTLTRTLAEAQADGMLNQEIAHLPRALTAVTVQTQSILEHLNERLDCLRQIAFGAADDKLMMWHSSRSSTIRSSALLVLGADLDELLMPYVTALKRGCMWLLQLVLKLRAQQSGCR